MMIERVECFEMRPQDRDYNKKGDDQRRRVYSTEGLSPTLLTPTGGYFETKIAIYENDMPKQQSERKATILE